MNTDRFDGAAKRYAVRGLRTDESTLVATYFPAPPARVLIVGCGGGRTVIPLTEQGYQVTGIDISHEMIEVARSQTSNAGISATLTAMDAAEMGERFRSQRFDAIWFPWHALDFVAPTERHHRALQAAANLLSRDGVCVFSTHNRLFPRTLRQYLLTHEGPYATLASVEGPLYTYTSLPWSAGKEASKFFSSVGVLPRYALIPPNHPRLKERLARITAPLLDKSLYVICKQPITS